MAQGFTRVVEPVDLTLIVNVGDDDSIYGAHVSADIDTVMYTLAGIQSPLGWGIADDTFTVMDHLESLGVDTSFRLGDRDLAQCLARTAALNDGATLTEVTQWLADRLGVAATVLPASNDPLRTKVQTEAEEWLDFQDYFVRRAHRDRVAALAFDGAESARPAPGVLEAIEAAALVVIAPSNPPLSIWPILAIPGIRDAVASSDVVVAVSPLFGGQTVKGPAADVLAGLGLPPGTQGVLAAYEGLLSDLVVDTGDADDVTAFGDGAVRIHVADTRIDSPSASMRLASQILTSRSVGAGGGSR